jgi:hypothetical protein
MSFAGLRFAPAPASAGMTRKDTFVTAPFFKKYVFLEQDHIYFVTYLVQLAHFLFILSVYSVES